MGSPTLRYDLQEQRTTDQVQFLFVSRGTTTIVKAVRFQYAIDFNGKPVFNLAFGDYDLESDTLDDSRDSNNGDVYRVFETVLSTIPLHFAAFADCYILVAGSDSAPAFQAHCQGSCNRNCVKGQCRKFRRRINIYRGYVDKHLPVLVTDFVVFGAVSQPGGQFGVEEYERYKKYDAVLICQRNL